MRFLQNAILSCCLLWPILPVPVRGATGEPTVDTVLEKYVTAIGGKPAWDKISSRLITAELEANGTTTEWKYGAKAPNKQFSFIDFPGLGLIAEGIDGSVAWSKDGNGVRLKEDEEAAGAKREAEFNSEVRMKQVYPGVAVVNRDKTAEDELILLQSKPAASSKEQFFFNKKSGFLVRHVSEFKRDASIIHIDRDLGDYREVDSAKYPHLQKVAIAVDGQEVLAFSLKVKEIKHNQPIEDSRFSRPSE
jgi:zinc protease